MRGDVRGSLEIETLLDLKISQNHIPTYDSAMCRLSDSTASHNPLTPLFIAIFTSTKHEARFFPFHVREA